MLFGWQKDGQPCCSLLVNTASWSLHLHTPLSDLVLSLNEPCPYQYEKPDGMIFPVLQPSPHTYRACYKSKYKLI